MEGYSARKRYSVYILTNKRRTVLYTGVTSNLPLRMAQHLVGVPGSFALKYRTTELVYVETYESVNRAIQREKEIKGYRTEKKVALIAAVNPGWVNLCEYS